MSYFCNYYTYLGRHQFEFDYKRENRNSFPGIYHAHQGIEILYIHQGEGQLILEQQIFDIKPGMLIIYQPFQLHHLQINLSHNSPFVRSLCTFEPSSFEQYIAPYAQISSFFHFIWKEKLPNQVISGIKENSEIIDEFRRFAVLSKSIQEGDHLEEYALFLISLFRHLRKQWRIHDHSTSGIPSRNMNHAEQVVKWIETHYMEKFELDCLAADLHLSKHHLCRLFREVTKNSIYDYLLARRIRQACLLLCTSEQAIQEIAQEVGFPSSSYFSKRFRESTGMTPRQYRLSSEVI